MIGMPIALGIYLHRRYRLGWSLFFAGAATFVGAQIFHIPFNYFVLQPFAEEKGLLGAEGGLELLLMGLLFGLSAGLFEEVARYLVYRRWLKNVRRWDEAVMYGTGHGGAEAVIFGAAVLLGLFELIAYRDVDLAALVPAERVEIAQLQVEMFWSAPWYDAMLGAVERVFAIMIQISLAVIVLQAVVRRNILWLVAAITWHTLVDAIAVIALRISGEYAAEALVAIMALLSLGILFFLKPKGGEVVEDEPLTPSPVPLAAKDFGEVQVEISEDKLTNSQYCDGV